MPITTGLSQSQGGNVQLATEATLQALLNEKNRDFELITVRDSDDKLYKLRISLDEANNTYVYDYIDENGNIVNPVMPVQFVDVEGVLTTIVGILNTIQPITLTLTSLSTTLSGNTPVNSKSVSFVVQGTGATINGLIRPDGWTQVFESSNNNLPSIPYNGNGTATIIIDILK